MSAVGKTIQAIATMVFNQGTEERKANLIIAPLALLEVGQHAEAQEILTNVVLQQWKDEIESRCERKLFKVHIYHGAKKEKSLKQRKKYSVYVLSFHFGSISLTRL